MRPLVSIRLTWPINPSRTQPPSLQPPHPNNSQLHQLPASLTPTIHPKLSRQLADLRQRRVDRSVRQQEMSGTRPFPIDGTLHESTSNRVVVQIVDRLHDRLRTDQIPIIARPFLPVTKRLHTRPLLIRELVEQPSIRFR